MKKILIIKLGYSETLDRTLSLSTSLGDVLRTTVILHYFKGDEIYWFVDRKALPLLENNKYIKKIYIYNSKIVNELKSENFDVIINFEKLPKICIFSDSLEAKERYGFNGFVGSVKNYFGGSEKLVEISQNIDKRRRNKDCWQKILADAIGKKWRRERYILGYRPRSTVKYDIGFNWTTSDKWENKSWPKAYWERLQELIKGKYSVSWQQGSDNLYDYIEWINSCYLIVTADTLGLHLCLALRKRVIALFGPTSHKEIYFYNHGSFLLPKSPYNCVPCLKPVCNKKRKCMEYIYPEKVKKFIKDEFEKIISSR